MKKYKGYVVTAVVAVLLFFCYTGGTYYLEKRIERELTTLSADSYAVRPGEVTVSLLSRQLILRDAQIESPQRGLTIGVPHAEAKGIRLFKLLFNNQLHVNAVVLDSPHILINNAPDNSPPESQPEKKAGNLHDALPFVAGKIDVNNASLLILENEADTLLYTFASLAVGNLQPGNSNALSFNGYSADQMTLSGSNTLYGIPGKLYRLQAANFRLDTREQALVVDRLHLSSLHSKYETAQQTGVETDWYDIKLKKLQVLGIDANALLSDTAIVFRKAVLDSIDGRIFRDKRLPFPEKPDTRLPIEMLQNLPFTIHSDTILITRSGITYEEHGEESTETGSVPFSNLYASIYNLSTKTDSIEGPTAMSARAVVMNEALLEAEFTFPNPIHPLPYSAAGTLSPTDLQPFNRMVEPSAFVRIDEGRLKSLNFDFSYDNDTSKGVLQMEYENLSITMLDKEEGTEKKLKTFITETFVLNQNNLKEDNRYTEGAISFERNKKKSIFNYWWKSLFSGIRDILAF